MHAWFSFFLLMRKIYKYIYIQKHHRTTFKCMNERWNLVKICKVPLTRIIRVHTCYVWNKEKGVEKAVKLFALSGVNLYYSWDFICVCMYDIKKNTRNKTEWWWLLLLLSHHIHTSILIVNVMKTHVLGFFNPFWQIMLYKYLNEICYKERKKLFDLMYNKKKNWNKDPDKVTLTLQTRFVLHYDTDTSTYLSYWQLHSLGKTLSSNFQIILNIFQIWM